MGPWALGPWAHGPGAWAHVPIKKMMKMHPLRVAMPPHKLIFGGNEAYGLQDAFGSVPGPPGPQKRAKNIKKLIKNRKNRCFPFFGPYFSFKGSSRVRIFPFWGHLLCSFLKGLYLQNRQPAHPSRMP